MSVFKNFKVIQVPVDKDQEIEVCLYRNIDADENQVVVITGFVFDEEEFEYQIQSEIEFASSLMAKCFIEDYSYESAFQFVHENVDRLGILKQAQS